MHDSFQNHAQFATLELPWLNNQPFVSCISPGTYKAVKTYSNTFGWCIHILYAQNRYGILIHAGNFYTNTKGCILVGNHFSYINADNQIDISNSKESLKILTTFFIPEIIFNITIQPTIYQK